MTTVAQVEQQKRLKGVKVAETFLESTQISNAEFEQQFISQQQIKRGTVDLGELSSRMDHKNESRRGNINHKTDIHTADNNLAVSTQKRKVTDETEARNFIFELFNEQNLYTFAELKAALKEKRYLVADKLIKQILNGSDGGEGIAKYEEKGSYRFHYHLNNRYSKQYEIGDRVTLTRLALYKEIQENSNFPRNGIYQIQEIQGLDSLEERKYRLMDTSNNINLDNRAFEGFELNQLD